MKTGSIEWTLDRLAYRLGREVFDITHAKEMHDSWWRHDFGAGWTAGNRFIAASDIREILRHARYSRKDFGRLAGIVRNQIALAIKQRKHDLAQGNWPYGPIQVKEVA